jgi:hypothetical protein
MKDLNIIRKIRNKFAHTAEDVSFDDADISINAMHYIMMLIRSFPRNKFIRVAWSVEIQIH